MRPKSHEIYFFVEPLQVVTCSDRLEIVWETLTFTVHQTSICSQHRSRQYHWLRTLLFWEYITTKMENTFEQRWAIKFCTKLDKNAAETYELLRQDYGESALLCVQVTRWVKKFKEGQKGVEDDHRSGRPWQL